MADSNETIHEGLKKRATIPYTTILFIVYVHHRRIHIRIPTPKTLDFVAYLGTKSEVPKTPAATTLLGLPWLS